MACSTDGCDRPVKARGWCTSHYNRWLGGGDPTLPLRTYGTGTPNGYPMVRVDGKLRAKHRVVMEQHLGRPLLPEENVHHKNGDRKDARLENLELWSTSQPSGQRVEDKVAWAREILALYG